MSKNKKVFTDNHILACMSKQPLTPAAIAEKCIVDGRTASDMTIVRALPRLYEEGLVEKIVIGSVHGKEIIGWYTELNPKKQRKRI